MKNLVKNLQRTIVLVAKLILYGALAAQFFFLYSLVDDRLWSFTRIAAISLITFFVVGILMLVVYGGYDIGKRKSKPIIYSIALATGITDLITYLPIFLLSEEADKAALFSSFGIFGLKIVGIGILTYLAQLFTIILMTYLGNYVFFRINRPEKCCLIVDMLAEASSRARLVAGIKKFKKQYKIQEIVDFRECTLGDVILRNDTIFLCDLPVEQRTALVELCYHHSKNIYFTPIISDVVEINARHVVLDDVSLIGAPVFELSLEQRFLKRAMDMLVSLIALILTSPVWLVCIIAIKAGDGGPVFFKQERATRGEQVFKVYKFRTMRENVENRSVSENDDRITPVGKVLRKLRIDELPQLLNILKGEMSLVGPRPEMLENVSSYTKELPEFAYRLRVKAGLTGYAQIAGKYNTSPRDKLFLDLMYIERYSIFVDIKLLLQTLIIFFKSDSTEAFTEDVQTGTLKNEGSTDINNER